MPIPTFIFAFRQKHGEDPTPRDISLSQRRLCRKHASETLDSARRLEGVLRATDATGIEQLTSVLGVCPKELIRRNRVVAQKLLRVSGLKVVDAAPEA